MFSYKKNPINKDSVHLNLTSPRRPPYFLLRDLIHCDKQIGEGAYATVWAGNIKTDAEEEVKYIFFYS